MKFLIGLAKVIAWFILVFAFIYIFTDVNPSLKIIVILAAIACVVFLIAMRRIRKSKLPGGIKGSAIQGVWVLEKHFRFDPALKKYEVVPVELKKNYFEFKGSNFRSGDFDENHKQLPAEYSPFSIEGDNVIIESEFFKKANWKWAIKNGRLELTGEMLKPKNSKSQFIFYRKNWR